MKHWKHVWIIKKEYIVQGFAKGYLREGEHEKEEEGRKKEGRRKKEERGG